MARMTRESARQLNDLFLDFQAGKIDRRALLTGAAALGASSMFLKMASLAGAQDATPVASPAASPIAVPVDASPSASGGGFTSINRQEWQAIFTRQYPFVADPGAESTGGTVVMGEIASSNLSTTNFTFADNSPTQPVLSLVFEALVATSPIDGQPVPGLADYWTIGEDGRTYTFYLTQSATWHDGQSFVAADVITGLSAVQDEATGQSYTGSFNSVVESFREVDTHTVEIVANDIYAQIVFFGNVFAYPMPTHIWGNVPHDQWKTDAGSTGTDPSRVVGTGPFRFQSLSEGEGTATFVANESYWDIPGRPPIDQFVFQTWPDEVAAIEALRAGQIDFYEAVPAPDIESLQGEESLTVAIYETPSFRWYGYNLDPAKTPLFQDVNVRRALYHAFDRELLANEIGLGYAVKPLGTQPTTSIAYDPSQYEDYVYDPTAAQGLLEAAGWVDSDGDGVREKDGVRFAFEIMYGAGSAQLDQMVAYLQESWATIGVEATPAPVDFSTVLVPALTENFDFQMCLLGFNWDSSYDQTAMFATSSYGAGFNAMKYSNPEFDRIAGEANRELDQARRVQLLIEASKIVWQDLPVGILWFRRDATAFQNRMHNYEPHANDRGGYLWSMPYVWVEQ